MEELPDPTTFVIPGSDDLYYGVCDRCNRRGRSYYKYGKEVQLKIYNLPAQFYVFHRMAGSTAYQCHHIVGGELCDGQLLIDNKYNERCVELANHFVFDKVDPPEMLDGDKLLSHYIRLYREWEPPTKPSIE